MPPLKLNVDLFPGILNVVPGRYQAIVNQNEPDQNQ
jgi:hypothetical protein